MTVHRTADRWLLAGVCVTLGLGVVSAGLPAVTTSELTTGRGELRLYLDVIEEGNLPTWWATAVLVVAAACASVVAGLQDDRSSRRRWASLAGLVALLSLDEATSLHERLHRFVDPGAVSGFPFLWLVPGAVLGTGVLVAVAGLLRTVPRSTRWWLLGGFALLLVSALGGELVQGLLLARGSTGPAYVLTYHAEEAGETLGALAILRAVVVPIVVVPLPDAGPRQTSSATAPEA